MSDKTIEVFQGEAKAVTLTIVDQDGTAVDVTTATFAFVAFEYPGATAVLTLTDAAFSAKGSGTATMALSAANTNLTPGDYMTQFTITFSASNIDINQEIGLRIRDAQ